jgi:hypothetical protein
MSKTRWKAFQEFAKNTMEATVRVLTDSHQQMMNRNDDWNDKQYEEYRERVAKEKLQIIKAKVGFWDHLRRMIDPSSKLTGRDIVDNFMDIVDITHEVKKVLGLARAAEKEDILLAIQQLKDAKSDDKDKRDPMDLDPKKPDWLPDWADEDWFKNHPSPPSEKGNACTHVEDLQDIIQLEVPANHSLPFWKDMLAYVRGLAAHVCPDPDDFILPSSPSSVPMPKMSDFPTFDGQPASLLKWTRRIASLRQLLYRTLHRQSCRMGLQ